MASLSPTPTYLSVLAQRSTNETVLLNTGNPAGYSNFLNTTFTYAGSTGVWTNVSNTFNVDPAGPLPVRKDSAFAWDGTNVMMFGGMGGSATAGIYNDTWTWNGTKWTQVALGASVVANTQPTGRFGCRAAYLSGTGTVMFGGTSSTGYLCQDSWQWSGSALTWTPLSPTVQPPFRKGHCMAASGSAVFVFGGEGTGGRLFNDMWSYSSSNWTQVIPTNTPPSVRTNAAWCWDSVNSVFVMFGGENAFNYLDETWTFNPSTSAWTLISNQISQSNYISGPYGKIQHSMCFDTNAGKSILFGGISAASNQAASETFLFNAATGAWTKIT